MSKLTIDINAKNNTGSTLDAIKSKLSNFSLGIGKMFAGIAGVIGAGAVIAKAKSTAEALDNLRDRSENFKMPTDELQRWEYAATDAGLGTEKFGNFLNKVNSLIQDTGKGGATGLAAIEKLAAINLDPSQFKGKSSSEALGMILDALSKVKDEQKALGYASDIAGDKMGKNLLGLAGNWRKLKAEVSSEKIFTQANIDAGENFTKQIAQLDITIQKLISGSGLLGWLTSIADKLDKVYSTKPDYKDTTIEQKIDYKDVAEKEMRIAWKDDGYAEKDTWQTLKNAMGSKNGTAKTVYKKPITDAMKEQWLDVSHPEWRQNKAKAEAEEKINAENKLKQAVEARAKAEKEANEENFKATIKRLEANPDIQKLGKITGQDGLTPANREELYNAKDAKERFEIEKGISDEGGKQVELATELKKIQDRKDEVNQSIKDSIAELQEQRKEQDLINAGKEKQAFIEKELAKIRKEAKKDNGRDLTADEVKKVTDESGKLYDSRELAKNKYSVGQSVINDKFSSIGGLGGKILSASDGTAKQQLSVAKEQLQATNKVVSAVKEIKPVRLTA